MGHTVNISQETINCQTCGKPIQEITLDGFFVKCPNCGSRM